MDTSSKIPSLSALALQYGTIDIEQHTHLNHLYSLKQKTDPAIDFEQLMISQKFATRYQVGLLKLIREYIIIKKHGEEFGKIAIEKGFAAKEDIIQALAYQKKKFKQAKIKRLIGDILVESRVITKKQKNMVLKEQRFFNTQTEKIFADYQSNEADLQKDQQRGQDINLSDYEKQFLQVKVLDQERIRKPDENITDSPVHIHISQDKMQALVRIKKKLPPVQLKDIKQAIENTGIRYGVYPDAILQCNLDMGNMEFIAARQGFSMELIEGRTISYHFDTTAQSTEIIKKGTTLAELSINANTCLKKDLFGNNIEQVKEHIFFSRCASGTRLSKDRKKIFAGKTGFACLSLDRKLYIHPAVNVLEDADLKYGPLERYANINISGILTGAYPVHAGNIMAREIRGARIEAIGSVRSHIGITDSQISAQGDIYAKYLHHCRIETFGNVYIENEIIDSQVFCSGRIACSHCRTIASNLYAKKGIELAGVGNTRTKRCILAAGTEHHILEKAEQIYMEIKNIRQKFDELKEKANEQNYLARKTFQKMIELKIFHDRASKRKEKLSNEFKKQRASFKKAKLKNSIKLIKNLEKRMEASISSLKRLNQLKKKYEKEKEKIKRKREKIKPEVERKTSELKTSLFLFFEWTRRQDNLSLINISGTIFQGTLLQGTFSSMEIKKNRSGLSAIEKQISETEFKIVVK